MLNYLYSTGANQGETANQPGGKQTKGRIR